MADQQFCLRWNNHQSTLISVFDSLLENGTLVDCTLAAEGQYLKAHKVVLSACSPYLEALLSQHYEKHPIVILKDVKFTELKSMMDYMYRGEVNISQDQLGTFLKAAESLQIKGLSDNGSDGDGRDVGSTSKGPPGKVQPAPSNRPAESQRPELSPPSSVHRSRDGSISPSSRKRRRIRRNSQGDDANMGDSHLDSNSCDLPNQAQSTPLVPNIPATVTSSISATPIKATIVKPEQTELVNRIDSSNLNSLPPESGLLKEKIEPISEPLLEPKTEYLDETNNDDSVEDLTLDDDDEMDEMDISNMSNMSNISRPGPSHGNDVSQMSNQGFVPWQIGNQSGTDEVFMAAQEAVQAHRNDSQDNPDQEQRTTSERRGKLKQRVGVLCKNCGSLRKENGLVVHTDSCLEEEKGTFQCRCGVSCSSKNELSIHRVVCGLTITKSKITPVLCLCGKYFSSKKMHSLHMKNCMIALAAIHYKPKVICKCGKECLSSRGLSLHKRCCPVFSNYKKRSNETKAKKPTIELKSNVSHIEPLCEVTEGVIDLTNKMSDHLQVTKLTRTAGIQHRDYVSRKNTVKPCSGNSNKVNSRKNNKAVNRNVKNSTSIQTDTKQIIINDFRTNILNLGLDTTLRNVQKEAVDCDLKQNVECSSMSKTGKGHKDSSDEVLVKDLTESPKLVFGDIKKNIKDQICEFTAPSVGIISKSDKTKKTDDKTKHIPRSDSEDDSNYLIIDLTDSSNGTISPDTPIKYLVKKSHAVPSSETHLNKLVYSEGIDEDGRFTRNPVESGIPKSSDNCSLDSLPSSTGEETYKTGKEIISLESYKEHALGKYNLDCDNKGKVACKNAGETHLLKIKENKTADILQTNLDDKESPSSNSKQKYVLDDDDLFVSCSSVANVDESPCKLLTNSVLSMASGIKSYLANDEIKENRDVEGESTLVFKEDTEDNVLTITDKLSSNIILETYDSEIIIDNRLGSKIDPNKYLQTLKCTSRKRTTNNIKFSTIYNKKLSKQRKLKPKKELFGIKIFSCCLCSFKVRNKMTLRTHVIESHSDSILQMLSQN